MGKKNTKKRKREKRVKKQINIRKNLPAYERARRARVEAKKGPLVGVLPQTSKTTSQTSCGAPGYFSVGHRYLEDGTEEIVTHNSWVHIKKKGPGGAPVAPQACKMCGRCCTLLSISSSIPGMPEGKPAGVRCVQLTSDNKCQLFGKPNRPEICSRYKADELCNRLDELVEEEL